MAMVGVEAALDGGDGGTSRAAAALDLAAGDGGGGDREVRVDRDEAALGIFFILSVFVCNLI